MMGCADDAVFVQSVERAACGRVEHLEQPAGKGGNCESATRFRKLRGQLPGKKEKKKKSPPPPPPPPEWRSWKRTQSNGVRRNLFSNVIYFPSSPRWVGRSSKTTCRGVTPSRNRSIRKFKTLFTEQESKSVHDELLPIPILSDTQFIPHRSSRPGRDKACSFRSGLVQTTVIDLGSKKDM